MPQLNDQLLQELPRFRDVAESIREVILANLVMIGEVPSPTFHEENRIQLLIQRFNEYGLQNCSVDEKMNGLGILPGEQADRNILIVTNADTLTGSKAQPMVEIHKDQVVGPFVGDNSLALAAMASIPVMLDQLKVKLRSNLILLAASRSLGRGNLEGLKFFLTNSPFPINYGLCLEGVQLGRLNYMCLGMMRGEIVCRLPRNYNWVKFGSTGTIVPMSDVIARIGKIPLPRRPLTSIVIGSIHGGISFQNIARQVTMSFELRSESSEVLHQIHKQIGDITDEVMAGYGIEVKLDIVTDREPGGLEISHPLIRCARTILTALDVKPMMYATTSMLHALIEQKIAGITLGFTTGMRRNDLEEIEEAVDIQPMYTGMAQLTGCILAMDKESHDES